MIEPLGRKGIEPLIDKTTEFTAQPVNQQTGPSLCYVTLLILSKEENIYILLYIFYILLNI